MLAYLFALLGGFDVDFGTLLEGLPEHVSHQGFPGQLHGHHVAGALQDRLWGAELAGGEEGLLLDGGPCWPKTGRIRVVVLTLVMSG